MKLDTTAKTWAMLAFTLLWRLQCIGKPKKKYPFLHSAIWGKKTLDLDNGMLMSFMRRSSKKRLRRKKVSQVTPTLMKYVRRPGNFLGKFENHEKCLICQKTFSKRWNNFFFIIYIFFLVNMPNDTRILIPMRWGKGDWP